MALVKPFGCTLVTQRSLLEYDSPQFKSNKVNYIFKFKQVCHGVKMALQYELVRAVLIFELFVFALIEIPFPSHLYLEGSIILLTGSRKHRIMKIVKSLPYAEHIQGLSRIILAVISLLFFGMPF